MERLLTKQCLFFIILVGMIFLAKPLFAEELEHVDESTPGAILIPDDEGILYWWAPPALLPASEADQAIYEELSDPFEVASFGQIYAEVIFVMDTSGSMYDEFDTLCSRIGYIVQELQNRGINLEYKILGITGTYRCANDTVRNNVSHPTVNHSEDWGPAVTDMSNQYAWKDGYARILVPMSDEGAENGNQWNSADDLAIDNAKVAAKNNSVAVIPVMCSGYYTAMVNAATELANYGWGEVFLSSASNEALIEGIINAINEIFNPVSDAVKPLVTIDDAYADAATCGFINKIAGDITYIVAQATNGETQDFTGDITVTFPNSWSLVGHQPVMKRKDMSSDEEEITGITVDTSAAGKVVLKNVTFTADNKWTFWKDESKTDQFVIKVIIPKNESPNATRTVNVSVSGNEIATAEDAFLVRIKDKGDIILTNRHLLYSSHSDTDTVNDIVREIHKIALSRDALVFYVDRWDEYDNFSGINPEGALPNDTTLPIKNWDQDNIDYTSEDTANVVSKNIDNYVDYWAGQLSGEQYLLIIGGDEVIPFYRTPVFSDTFQEKEMPQRNPDYSKNTPLFEAIQNNYYVTDSVYADTKGDDWGNGDVELATGRIVGATANSMVTFLDNCDKGPNDSDNMIVVADSRNEGKNIAKEAKDSNFDVLNDDETPISIETENWTDNDLMDMMKKNFRLFWHASHGDYNELCCGSKSSTRLDSDEIIDSDNVGDIGSTNPFISTAGCHSGLLGNTNSTKTANDNLTWAFIESGCSGYMGSSSVVYCSPGGRMGVNFHKEVFNKKSIGKAFKNTLVDFDPSDNFDKRTVRQFILYGMPWMDIQLPETNQNISMLTIEASLPAIKSISNQGLNLDLISEVTISSCTFETVELFEKPILSGDFDEVIYTSNTYEPVIPYIKKQYILPSDVNIIDVTINRTTIESLGFHNLPSALNDPFASHLYTNITHVSGNYPQWEMYYALNRIGEKSILNIYLAPLIFDIDTKEVVLYKDIDIQITYETEVSGVLLEAGLDKDRFVCGEDVNVHVGIENIVDHSVQFDAVVKLKDPLENVIESQTVPVTVDSGQVQQTTLQLQAPSTGGSYWVETTLFEGTEEIGSSRDHITVVPGQITKFDVSRIVPGERAEFAVSFLNETNNSVKATYGLQLYEISTEKADFIPIVYTIPGATEQKTSFFWDVPVDVPLDNVDLAVCTVAVDGYVASESQDLIIGNDTTPPVVTVTSPDAGTTVQENITLSANVTDESSIATTTFTIREDDGGDGTPVGFENLSASYNGGSGLWEYDFDTLELADGDYLVSATAVDEFGNEGVSEAVPFSIDNWVEVGMDMSPVGIARNETGQQLIVQFNLPDGIGVNDVDMQTPVVLQQGGIEATDQWCVSAMSGSHAMVFATFDAAAVLGAIPANGAHELKVYGRLNNGKYFFGLDMLHILETADINRDGTVGFADVMAISSQWMSTSENQTGDIAPSPAGDGIVNYADFAEILANWTD